MVHNNKIWEDEKNKFRRNDKETEKDEDDYIEIIENEINEKQNRKKPKPKVSWQRFNQGYYITSCRVMTMCRL